jgi:hypothetical protein
MDLKPLSKDEKTRNTFGPSSLANHHCKTSLVQEVPAVSFYPELSHLDRRAEL